MLATVALLRLSGRRWPWPQVWLLTCAVVVALDPWALLQAGFWLSFVAVAILFATDSRADSAYPAGAGGRFYALLREQGGHAGAYAPWLLLFGQVSLVGWWPICFAIPWVTLVVTPLVLLGTLWAPLWLLAARRCSRWWPCCNGWHPGLGPRCGYRLHPCGRAWSGWLAVRCWSLRLPWPVRALGVPLLVPVLLWQAPRPAPGQFELLAADVGQGNAVLVRTATHSLLYDTGRASARTAMPVAACWCRCCGLG